MPPDQENNTGPSQSVEDSAGNLKPRDDSVKPSLAAGDNAAPSQAAMDASQGVASKAGKRIFLGNPKLT